MTLACPTCRRSLTSEGTVDVTPGERPRTPRPGDYAICAACAAVARVAPDGGALLALTPAEIAALPADLRAMVDAAPTAIQFARRRAAGAGGN